MTLQRDLRDALVHYDGRNTSVLTGAADRFAGRRGFMSALVALAGDPCASVSNAATWLLKSALEQGQTLTPAQTARLIDGLDRITAWQAQLHICQIVPYLTVPDRATDRLCGWLTPMLNSDRPFLRAWALDALCHLPGTDRGALFERLARDPAASVRARIRRLQKTPPERGARRSR